MSPSEFDSFLVKTKIGGSRTLKRLTPAERWCYVAGVLALASESPVRGALLIAEDEPVTTADLADQAGVPRSTASSCVEKLTRLGKLEHDSELGCLIVVRWHSHQPEPKPSDSREAWRDRKQRQRDKARDGHAGHARDVTPMSRHEVKRREETPPLTPPPGGKRTRNVKEWKETATAWCRSNGVDGPDASLLRALEQATPWTRNGDSVEHFRRFAHQHFSRTLTVEAA